MVCKPLFTADRLSKHTMSLSVLIPAYNERATIEELIHTVLAERIVSQVVIVDDGSTDGTRDFLATVADTDDRVQVFLHEQNLGKGAAIRTALQHATEDITIIQDADLEYHPSDYAAVIQPIQDGQSRVVYGSRVLCRDNEYPIDTFRVGSFVVTQLANLLYGCRLTDEPTCYKAFDTELLKSLPLEASGFELCPELTAWTRKRGEAIAEVPIRYSKRTVAEGKKIRWQDGVIALWTLLRLRFK
jgi:glycosyltransferase involved in cell wall biosynthesis